ncbi:hypothetical protein AJ80_01681 [Polytolypa hystricis UAMH7299]|uniref:PH domain-containing protein n=1 Tax=Polytolypa hystricis (strain UAMH7299) TaxID=1447883 RepID=A0A2B7Z0E9_POLH7|nr:hypothetical protein AJ80_01681 [Polytolypa hystricis UAMH7299]
MAAGDRTLSHDAYAGGTSNNNNNPNPNDISHLSRGYGSRPNSYMTTSIVPSDFQARGGEAASPIAAHHPHHNHHNHHNSRFHEDFSSITAPTSSRRSSSMIIDGMPPPATAGVGDLQQQHQQPQRPESQISVSHSQLPSRAGTLRKKPSLGKKGSLRRAGSRRSSRAGSVRSMNLGEKEKYGVVEGDEINSAFYVPIPTTGNPTEVMAARFQAWRRILKDLITYFRDLQRSYETRAKILISASNIMNNTTIPYSFLASGGLGDANAILKDYHKQAVAETNKARDVQTEIIIQLTGLRNDLSQKIKEIKSLSGDFKNSVDKEVEGTRKAVRHLQEALGLVDTDPAATSGKGDPFIVRLGVEKQLERQIDEENYLHRAYFNLEGSGRDLEAIVVGEIQKAYNAFGGILKREADVSYDAAERLRDGPVSMPKDHEWNHFVSTNDNLVDPRVPIRNLENIIYPGKDHPAAVEVRAGMLERKSKYLKSYTPGWYVLSPTHLHEFKSDDRLAYQTPVVSLYLPEQKLGTHSSPGSKSHKFSLKGRQTGAMHRGHSWVFRAESHDTMLEWFNDIQSLTDKTGEVRNAFVRRHIRTFSGRSYRASFDSERAMDEDEADETPYAANQLVSNQAPPMVPDAQWRPQPGGRFPSEVRLSRQGNMAHSPSSGLSIGEQDPDAVAAAAAMTSLPDPAPPDGYRFNEQQTPMRHPNDLGGVPNNIQVANDEGRHNSLYGDWMTPAAANNIASTAPSQRDPHYQQQQQQQQQQRQQQVHVSYRNPITPDNTAPSQQQQQQQQPPLQSVASSTGAPMIISTGEILRANSTEPTSQTRTSTAADNRIATTGPPDSNERGGMMIPTASEVGVPSAATTVAGGDGGSTVNGDDVNRPTGPRKLATFSDMKFPGQYPTMESR